MPIIFLKKNHTFKKNDIPNAKSYSLNQTWLGRQGTQLEE